jgi:thioredoxin-like negative regulator of GroEL
LAQIKSGIVLVFFYANWYKPVGQQIEQILTVEATENAQIKFLVVNIDDFNDLATSCSISGMLTIFCFINNRKVDDYIGQSPHEIKKFIKRCQLTSKTK